MHEHLEVELKGAKSEQQVIDGITKAFDKCESEFLDVTRHAFAAGFPKTAYVGSCALVAVVVGEKLYVANCGDCKAVLIRQKEETGESNGAGTPAEMEAIKVSKTFSANKKYEQERLTKEFKNEKDVFICKRNDPKACYVKGGLMPSRSIGDFRLKYREFNFHKFTQ